MRILNQERCFQQHRADKTHCLNHLHVHVLMLWEHLFLVILRKISQLRLSNELLDLALGTAKIIKECECLHEIADSEIS